MKLTTISFACLIGFIASVHSQTFGPYHTTYVISLEYIKSSLRNLWSAIDEYPATHLNLHHINVNQSIATFVVRAQELVQVFQDGKTITDCSGNMIAHDTLNLHDLLAYAGFMYFQMTTLLHSRIREIKNASRCETTRTQLTDINTNAHSFIYFLYSRAHPEWLKHIAEMGDELKRIFDSPQHLFSEKNCEKSCLGD